MTPIKQTRFSDPEKGIHGNCFSACIASLLDLSINDVPDFSALGNEWSKVYYEFMNKQPGIIVDGCKYSIDKKSYPNDIDDYPGIDDYVIVGGSSLRDPIRGHAVIYNHKTKTMAHDPHPSNDGLVNIGEIYMIRRKEINK